MTDHTSLIARLESAGEGSKALSMDVVEACGDCAHRETEYYCIQGDSGFTCTACGEDPHRPAIAPVTTSIDAALALAQRVLPGCCPGVAKNVHRRDWYAWIGDKHEEGPLDLGNGRSGSPALALSAAILKALSTASEESK